MIIKTALVAAFVLGSASLALAATHHHRHYGHGFQTRGVALPYGGGYGSARESWMDRASRNWSGGGY